MSTPRMKPAVKKAWVDALRSGKYKQAFEYDLIKPDPDDPDGEPLCDALAVLTRVAIDMGYGDEVVRYLPHLESNGKPGFMTWSPQLDPDGEIRTRWIEYDWICAPDELVPFIAVLPPDIDNPERLDGDPDIGAFCETTVATLNHQDHKTFLEIADAIEGDETL